MLTFVLNFKYSTFFIQFRRGSRNSEPLEFFFLWYRVYQGKNRFWHRRESTQSRTELLVSLSSKAGWVRHVIKERGCIIRSFDSATNQKHLQDRVAQLNHILLLSNKADTLLCPIWGSNLCLRSAEQTWIQSWGINAPVTPAVVAQLLWLLLFSNMLWINGPIFTLFLTCICTKGSIWHFGS